MLGFLFILLGTILLLAVTFFILPKFLIRYVYQDGIKEGEKSSDFTYYLSEKENQDVFDSYRIFYDKKAAKKVLQIDFKEEIHRVKFYVIFFDYASHPIECKEYVVEDAQFRNEILAPINARGAYVQVMELEDTVFVKKTPLVLDMMHLIIASVLYGILAAGCAFVCGIGFVWMVNGAIYSIFEMRFPFLFIMILISFVLFTIGGFFLIRYTERERLGEKKEANV